MRRFLVIAIPIVTLIFFVLVMISGDFLKQSPGERGNIPQVIEMIIQDVTNENWEAAGKNTDYLSRTWERVVKRVQFSSERNEIDDFLMNIARLKGAIQAQDKSSGLQELNEAYAHWKFLGK